MMFPQLKKMSLLPPCPTGFYDFLLSVSAFHWPFSVSFRTSFAHRTHKQSSNQSVMWKERESLNVCLEPSSWTHCPWSVTSKDSRAWCIIPRPWLGHFPDAIHQRHNKDIHPVVLCPLRTIAEKLLETAMSAFVAWGWANSADSINDWCYLWHRQKTIFQLSLPCIWAAVPIVWRLST